MRRERDVRERGRQRMSLWGLMLRESGRSEREREEDKNGVYGVLAEDG